jgi:hypothetical protein
MESWSARQGESEAEKKAEKKAVADLEAGVNKKKSEPSKEKTARNGSTAPPVA